MITYNEANLFGKKVVIQKITFLKKVKSKTDFIVGLNRECNNDNLQ